MNLPLRWQVEVASPQRFEAIHFRDGQSKTAYLVSRFISVLRQWKGNRLFQLSP